MAFSHVHGPQRGTLLRISSDRDTQRNFLGGLFEEGFILEIQTNLKIRGSSRLSLHVVP